MGLRAEAGRRGTAESTLYLLTHEHIGENAWPENKVYVTDFSFIRVFTGMIVIEDTLSVLVSTSAVWPLRYRTGFPPVRSFLSA